MNDFAMLILSSIFFLFSIFLSLVPKNVIRRHIIPAMPNITDIPVHPKSSTKGMVVYEIRIMTA